MPAIARSATRNLDWVTHLSIMNESLQPNPWIDEEGSRQLPLLCAQGEGQTLEYMQEFPSNARELAKEIAAFATSNAGTILIGVDDKGRCVGIAAAEAPERDKLLHRLEGICTNAVKPSITPTARFTREGEHVILMILVPKGIQPIYYANDVPYVRHITSSRPAQPHEVIELIQGTIRPIFRKTARESIEERPDKRVQFLAELMRNLTQVVIFGDELEHRTVNPWLDLLRSQFGSVASALRQAAADQIAVDEKLDAPLLDASEALDRFAKLRLHLGSGQELDDTAKTAIERARELLRQIEPHVTRYVSRDQLIEQLGLLRRQTRMLAVQAENAPQVRRMGELQSNAAELGLKVLNFAQYDIDRLKPDLHVELVAVGHQLHLSETERIYLDGGESVRRITEHIKGAIERFSLATENALPREAN
jgi:ATP-dependent DNA helicase RecG